MTWASPWAGLLAVGVVLPLIAHLWSRRHARTVAFPSLRFLRASSPVARRLRTVQDWPLLLGRALLVLLVAAAAAGPTVRRGPPRGADIPVHRVIIVDEAVAAAATADVARLAGGAATAETLEPGPIAALIAPAAARARLAAPGRRSEIVLLWDGSRRTLDERDLAAIPGHFGVRLAAVAPPAPTVPVPASTLPVVFDAMSDHGTVAALRQRLAQVRVPAPLTAVQIIWPSAAQGAEPAPGRLPTRLTRLMDDLADDVRVQEAAERSVRDGRAPPVDSLVPGRPIARGAALAPLLRVWVANDRLVVASDATPASPVSWWAAVAPLEGQVRWERLGGSAERWTPEALQAASREAASAPGWLAPAGRDTRAAWAIVLVLLLGEQWWRHRLRGVGGTDAP